MAVFKCKMCGGDIVIADGEKTFGTCEFCGCTMTLPKFNDEQRLATFNRGNQFRRAGEFDKAASLYENLIQENDADAEAHWCCALSRFGIEYVEDPATLEYIPTCHRASYDNFLEDVDYLAALEHSDGITRRQYQKEAMRIAEIQKDILRTSRNEQPFDVFICYKEADESGQRTVDSTLAQDIYYQLTDAGYRVFFSRITLEDKAGTEFEPYIFAALNSAKVMVVVGTKPEYLNAVWVKNEWSRFLVLMKKDRSKLLLPCYRDMDPYDMPEALSILQSYDMSRIGFIQDLIRGIKKVIAREQPQAPVKETVVVQQTVGSNTGAGTQIKRGSMALEDHDWEKADGFFEEALNLDPECAEAYLGKMLAQERVSGFDSWVARQKEKYDREITIKRLEACPANEEYINAKVKSFAIKGYLDQSAIRPLYEFDRGYDSTLECREKQKVQQLKELSENRLLARAKQYAKGETLNRIEQGIASIQATLDQRITNAQEEDRISIVNTKESYAVHLGIADKKVSGLAVEAQKRQEQSYQSAVDLMNNAENISAYRDARNALNAMNGYKDSQSLAEECREAIERLERCEESRKAREEKKRKMIAIIAAAVAVVCVAAALFVINVIIPNNHYNAAVKLMNDGEYEAAIDAFTAMNGYKDSADQIKACQDKIKEQNYNQAVALMDSGEYEAAIDAFTAMNGYKDSADQVKACQDKMKEQKYDQAVALMDSGDYDAAIDAFTASDGYKDSADQIIECKYNQAGSFMNEGEYVQARSTFKELGDYKDSINLKAECGRNILKNPEINDEVDLGNYDGNTEWIVLDQQDNKVLLISKYAVTRRCYNYINDVTWEICSLRTWLNSTYLNEAFSAEEQAMIDSTDVVNDDNPSYGTKGGNDTTDRVFLLSIDEVEKYFASNDERAATLSDGTSVWWWLRSPGDCSRRAARVDGDGSVTEYGYYVDIKNGAVRPALWVDVSNL